MRVLIKEKLSPNKYKTPEGYLVCVDAILARTGKQQYRRNELYVDSDDDSIVDVDRPYDEVFSEQTIASFENKPFVNEHPNEDVNVHNHKDYAVGFVRDVHKGEVDGEPVLLGNLIITDEETIAEIESGEKTELSCGYDCDITDDENPCQRNIRGNHVALCKAGRAGIARIVDSKVEDSKMDIITSYGFEKINENARKINGTDVEIMFKYKGTGVFNEVVSRLENKLKINASYIDERNKIVSFYKKSIQDSIKDVRTLSISGWEYKDNDFSKELNELKQLFNSNNIKDGRNKLNKLLDVARDCLYQIDNATSHLNGERKDYYENIISQLMDLRKQHNLKDGECDMKDSFTNYKGYKIEKLQKLSDKTYVYQFGTSDGDVLTFKSLEEAKKYIDKNLMKDSVEDANMEDEYVGLSVSQWERVYWISKKINRPMNQLINEIEKNVDSGKYKNEEEYIKKLEKDYKMNDSEELVEDAKKYVVYVNGHKQYNKFKTKEEAEKWVEKEKRHDEFEFKHDKYNKVNIKYEIKLEDSEELVEDSKVNSMKYIDIIKKVKEVKDSNLGKSKLKIGQKVHLDPTKNSRASKEALEATYEIVGFWYDGKLVTQDPATKQEYLDMSGVLIKNVSNGVKSSVNRFQLMDSKVKDGNLDFIIYSNPKGVSEEREDEVVAILKKYGSVKHTMISGMNKFTLNSDVNTLNKAFKELSDKKLIAKLSNGAGFIVKADIRDSKVKDSVYKIKTFNNKWYYEETREDGYSNLVGPFKTSAEARAALQKHRPNVKVRHLESGTYYDAMELSAKTSEELDNLMKQYQKKHPTWKFGEIRKDKGLYKCSVVKD